MNTDGSAKSGGAKIYKVKGAGTRWLAPTKAKVLERAKAVPEGIADHLRDLMLFEVTGQKAYNVSPCDFAKLAADPDNLAANARLASGGCRYKG